MNHTDTMKLAIEALAVKFSEGWHEGIKIDASDIMLLNDAAQALAEQPAQQEPVATKLETQQFGCFHVSAEDFQRLKNLPVGTNLYTRPQTREPEQCTWTQVDDEHMPDTWQADCGAMWTFTDGGPKDNDMHYCPKCGKPTIEAAHNIKEQL